MNTPTLLGRCQSQCHQKIRHIFFHIRIILTTVAALGDILHKFSQTFLKTRLALRLVRQVHRAGLLTAPASLLGRSRQNVKVLHPQHVTIAHPMIAEVASRHDDAQTVLRPKEQDLGMEYTPRSRTSSQPVPVWFGHNNAIVVAVAIATIRGSRITCALNNLDGLQYGISHLLLSSSPPALGDMDGSRIVPHDEQLPHAAPERVLHPSRPGANECRAQAFLRGVRDEVLEGDVAEGHGFLWTDPISVDGPPCEGSVGEGSGGCGGGCGSS